MKEDILEQLVDDYLQAKGYFTRHNIKFRPRPDHPDFVLNQDSNHSDLDVLGVNPLVQGPDRVWAVSCKSWQSGLGVKSTIRQIEDERRVAGRPAWKSFRELLEPKWTDAFKTAVQQATGAEVFTYVTAVTAIRGNPQEWEGYARFEEAMAPNPIKLLSFDEMLAELEPRLGTTVASSQLSRTLQLMKAAGYLRRPKG